MTNFLNLQVGLVTCASSSLFKSDILMVTLIQQDPIFSRTVDRIEIYQVLKKGGNDGSTG